MFAKNMYMINCSKRTHKFPLLCYIIPCPIIFSGKDTLPNNFTTKGHPIEQYLHSGQVWEIPRWGGGGVGIHQVHTVRLQHIINHFLSASYSSEAMDLLLNMNLQRVPSLTVNIGTVCCYQPPHQQCSVLGHSYKLFIEPLHRYFWTNFWNISCKIITWHFAKLNDFALQ